MRKPGYSKKIDFEKIEDKDFLEILYENQAIS